MKSYLFGDESDIQLMRDLIKHLPANELTAVDFEEAILLASVQATTRLWQVNGKTIGFAFVDDYNNLRFEIQAESRSAQVENEIIAWGIACIKARNAKTGKDNTLDAVLRAENIWQIAMLERTGFVRSSLRTLRYARSLHEPIMKPVFPSGFSLRCVAGEDEVESLVTLHRAVFGTENMTIAERLAIMHTPTYDRELDLVAVTSGGELAAFCICSLADEMNSEKVGFTDPIGTHPRYQQRGLGKALVTAGLQRLKKRGVAVVELGTSSNNIPMQQLAQSLGFTCIAEKLWFSKSVA